MQHPDFYNKIIEALSNNKDFQELAERTNSAITPTPTPNYNDEDYKIYCYFKNNCNLTWWGRKISIGSPVQVIEADKVPSDILNIFNLLIDSTHDEYVIEYDTISNIIEKKVKTTTGFKIYRHVCGGF